MWILVYVRYIEVKSGLFPLYSAGVQLSPLAHFRDAKNRPISLQIRQLQKASEFLVQEAVQFFLAHAKSKRFEPKAFAECVDSFLEHQAANNVKAISVPPSLGKL